MTGELSPLLTTADWNEEWKALQTARQHADDPAVWDEKAKTFPVKHGSQAGYVEQFLKLAGVQPGETVLDMGCGTGALTTPLAQQGNRVIACDFSQGMVDAMLADQRSLGVSGVETHIMSWDDDWNSHGVTPKSADIAIASRSIATYDLKEALLKLDTVARRRVCITLPSGPSPRADERLMEAAGIKRHLGQDFLYAFNILASLGLKPEVAYIPSPRAELFDSPEDACAKLSAIATQAAHGLATPQEISCIPERIGAWLEQNLKRVEGGYSLVEDRTVTWAFIAWNTTTAA